MSACILRILVIFAFTANLQAFQSRATNPPPEVIVTITEQTYCLGRIAGFPVDLLDGESPDRITLALRLQLTFRNIGHRPLILPVLLDFSKLIVSHKPGSMAKASERVVAPLEWGEPDLKYIGLDTLEPNKAFELIPPGGGSGDYFAKTHFPIHVVVFDPSPRVHVEDLRGTKIFLQLEVDHLRFPKDLADTLAKRWARYGYLWTGTTRTQAIHIEIPRTPGAVACQGMKID